MAVFYPLINKNKIFNSSTIIYNFPPNNYEGVPLKTRYLSLLSVKDGKWETLLIKEMKPFESYEINYEAISYFINQKSMPILSLTENPLEKSLTDLPTNTIPNTTPEWRASICIHRKGNTSSYQGELQPFPEKATLLSFSTFLQKKHQVKNFLLFINIENKPVQRVSNLILTLANNPNSTIDEISVSSNTCNFIDLNKYKINDENLLVIYSHQISGIPIFFSYSDDDNSMSLEHTHPPSSFIIHDKRKEFQKKIKKNWFDYLSKKND